MLGPDELYLVFQHLHRALEAVPFERADTRTALACCLAGGSPELLERSRALLYSRVVLRLYDVSQIDNLGKSLRSPHLASLIRRVDTRTWDSSVSSDGVDFLNEVWALCPNIERIAFHQLRPADLEDMVKNLSTSLVAPTLRHLLLSHSPSSHPLPPFCGNGHERLDQVLSRFPALESLSLAGGNLGSGMPLVLHARLTSISLIRCTLAPSLLLIEAAHTTLLHLDIEVVWTPDATSYTPNALAAPAVRLRTFRFNAKHLALDPLELVAFHEGLGALIESFPNATSVDLTMPAGGGIPGAVRCLDQVVHALPKSLVSFRAGSLHNYGDEPGDLILSWLSDRARFPALKVVAMMVVGELRLAVQSRCEARGIRFEGD